MSLVNFNNLPTSVNFGAFGIFQAVQNFPDINGLIQSIFNFVGIQTSSNTVGTAVTTSNNATVINVNNVNQPQNNAGNVTNTTKNKLKPSISSSWFIQKLIKGTNRRNQTRKYNTNNPFNRTAV
ncbi:MAG: hypothetical protein PHC64_01760, partial [Candidatus Gastranaerophilales bacterium]|nr:hypothetical protein [Candidatus Gastranaerophilales bacterium]